MNKLKKAKLLIVIVGCLILAGCGSNKLNTDEKTNPKIETGFILSAPGNYDSIDIAVVVKKDIEEKKITLINQETGKRYTLNFDGATYFYNKYDENIALSQIESGDIVEVTFMKERKRLNSLQKSAKSFLYGEIINHDINEEEGTMTIGKDKYSLDEKVFISSNGIEMDLGAIHPCDQIKIEGYDRNIESIRIDRGHGYLSLLNDESFIGGWIEIGQTTIQMITEAMIIPVPEGTYLIQISSGASGGKKEVIIERNKEVKLDISDLNIEEPKMGGIIFSVTPTEAIVFIDGEEVDISAIVDMKYGIHQMLVKAEGYVSVMQYLKVGTTLASINIALDPEDKETSIPDDAEATQKPTTTTGDEKGERITSTTSDMGEGTVTTTYTVMIETPIGAEVYVDGTYVGISPTNFPKVSGDHVITLRKTGFQTRNYTLNIGIEKKSVNYSFSELLPLE